MKKIILILSLLTIFIVSCAPAETIATPQPTPEQPTVIEKEVVEPLPVKEEPAVLTEPVTENEEVTPVSKEATSLGEDNQGPVILNLGKLPEYQIYTDLMVDNRVTWGLTQMRIMALSEDKIELRFRDVQGTTIIMNGVTKITFTPEGKLEFKYDGTYLEISRLSNPQKY